MAEEEEAGSASMEKGAKEGEEDKAEEGRPESSREMAEKEEMGGEPGVPRFLAWMRNLE